MPTTTSTQLETIIQALAADMGLKAGTSTTDYSAGIAAARQLNDVLGEAIEHFGFNADKLITAEEMMQISDYVRATPLLHYYFLMGHGNDEGNVETGFHKLQNDGGELMFQGRKLVDTVIDAIYHYGEEYMDGRFVNEDGNQNEEVADVAGWLNYFLNGRTVVFGSDGDDHLGSGDYSAALMDAASETFQAGAGNDKVWAHTGHDKIYAGTGDDEVGGGSGNDQIWGDAGADRLYGETGNDKMSGGAGDDQMGGGEGDDEMSGDDGDDSIGGGEGNDTLSGGDGHDDIWGDTGNDNIDGGDGNDSIGGGEGRNTLKGGAGNDDVYGGDDRDMIEGGGGNDALNGSGGNDRISGDAGNDEIHGSDGDDKLMGGDGDDVLSAGEGRDWLRGGAGSDTFYLWDADDARDTLIFGKAESGRTLGTLDIVEGFQVGEDKIDLRAFGPMTLEALDFVGGGAASCYFDGRHLRIDEDGDRASDMIIQFKWTEDLTASDFIFA